MCGYSTLATKLLSTVHHSEIDEFMMCNNTVDTMVRKGIRADM